MSSGGVIGLKCLTGALLVGDAPVRYVYVDEAGTSAKEPVSVVVGIIVHADTKWRPAEDALLQLKQKVPERWREGFISHAAAIWGDPKYRDVWDFKSRLSFLHELMSTPRKLGLPISLGIVRRTAPMPPDPEITLSQSHHRLAFGMCIASADNYLCNYTPENEVATVVAEDVTELRGPLRKIIQHFRGGNLPLSQPEEHQIMTRREREVGRRLQRPIDLNVRRIVHAVHFTSKEDDPILQIADACAFGFRRYFSDQSYGDGFVKEILGADLIKEDWAGYSSMGTFFGHAAKVKFTYRCDPVWRVEWP